MRPAHQRPFIAALATAAALSLAGCGAVAQSASSGTAVARRASPRLRRPPLPPPRRARRRRPAKPSSSATAPAALATYTFPDGRLSFKYPADWKVELFTGDVKPSTSRTATVFDASGTKQVTVYSGLIADGVTHPVTRTVFESAPVPGLRAAAGPRRPLLLLRGPDGQQCHVPHAPDSRGAAGREGHGARRDHPHREGSARGRGAVHREAVRQRCRGQGLAGGAEGQAIKALLLSVTYR